MITITLLLLSFLLLYQVYKYMNKRRAIKIINKQRYKLTNLPINISWVKQTQVYIEAIFGKEHEYTVNMGNYKTVFLSNEDIENLTPYEIENIYNDSSEKINDFLNTVIDTIKNIGVPTKRNFLSTTDNAWLIAGCVFIIPIIFSIGYTLGYYKVIIH